MKNMLVLALRRTAAALFPSVPPADRALILTAMDQPYPTTPVSGSCGEAGPEAGALLVGGATSTPASPTGTIPPVEDLRNWRAHPSHRWEFSDLRLDALLDRWAKEA